MIMKTNLLLLYNSFNVKSNASVKSNLTEYAMEIIINTLLKLVNKNN